MIVAIVGRPNVGKSSIFNRLIGRRRALVWDQEGVTRDRLVEHFELPNEKKVELWDLAGWESRRSFEDFPKNWLQEIDLFLWVVDGASSFDRRDDQIREFLRKSGKSVLVWLNKSDRKDFETNRDDWAKELRGFREVLEGSAETKKGVGDLLADFVARSEKKSEKAAPRKSEKKADHRVLIVGRPNVGKSSLLNRMAGTMVSQVQDEPGTTRDLVSHHMKWDGETWEFIDSAGVRKKSKIYKTEDPVEIFSSLMALNALKEVDVVILLAEAHPRAMLHVQEKKLFKLVKEAGRPSLIVVNKWDQVREQWKAKNYRQEVLYSLGLSDEYEVAFVSAKTGYGVKTLKQLCQRCVSRMRKIGTPQLNRWLKEIQAYRSPRITKKGLKTGKMRTPTRYLKYNYMVQTHQKPMRFQIFTNAPQAVPKDEKRFLEKRLREDFNLGSLPIELMFRRKNEAR